MRIYLGGSSHETSRVNATADKLTAHGVQVVSTWHRETDRALLAGFDDRYDVETAGLKARLCLRELLEADVVWVLWPRTASRGAYVELGYALGAAGVRDVVVSGVGCSSTIFTSLADYRDTSDEAALHEVLMLARRYQIAEAAL